MTAKNTDAEPPLDPHEALELALRSQGWRAAPAVSAGEGRLRLAGRLIDDQPELVTDLVVQRGTASTGFVSITTRLPLLVPALRRHQASQLCSAINVLSSPVHSLDAVGRPTLWSKLVLFAPEELAAERIVDSVRDHRPWAEWATVAFASIARGESAASVASGETDLAQSLPFAQRLPVASVLDLSLTPEPSPEGLKRLQHARDSLLGQPAELAAVLTEHEVTPLARVEALQQQQPDAAWCAGPLMSHADGTLECYACTSPATRIHVSTAICRPGRRLGRGHLCRRCDPS